MACIPAQFTTSDRRYRIASHGNGWAYEITDTATGKTLWFQDDTAWQVQYNTNDFEDTELLADYFACIDE